MKAWLVLVCLGGCLAAQPDGFRDRLARGCHSTQECKDLGEQARARVQDCARRQLPCGQAERDLTDTLAYLLRVEPIHAAREQRQQERERSANEEAQRSALENSKNEAAAARKAEAERLALAEDERRRADEKDARDRAAEHTAWLRSLGPKARELKLRTCHAEQSHPCQAEFLSLLEAVESEKEREALTKLQAKRVQEYERTTAPSSRLYPAKCCDGTLSPSCMCSGNVQPSRGCCSHHGGVCGCGS